MNFKLKKALSILIVVCMLAAALPISTLAANRTAGSWAELVSAVGSSSSGDTVTLTADVTANSLLTVSGNVTIIGAGHTITRASNFSDNVFVVNGTLSLENVTLNGNRTSTAQADLANALVAVNSGGVFNLRSGTTLTTNRANSNVSGGGVSVCGGTLNMYTGSTIKDMHINLGSQKVGPAVTVYSGAFNMYDGRIWGCDGVVGAVAVQSGGTFTMSGGEIDTNISAPGNNGDGGGGVHNAGTFTMTGGSIHNNQAWARGGGVYNAGTFNFQGGSITENASTPAAGVTNPTTYYGGGIFSVGTLNISGGEITTNGAHNCGGGIFVDAGVCTITNGTI